VPVRGAVQLQSVLRSQLVVSISVSFHSISLFPSKNGIRGNKWAGVNAFLLCFEQKGEKIK